MGNIVHRMYQSDGFRIIRLPVKLSGNSSLVNVSTVRSSVVSIEYKLSAPSSKPSYRRCIDIKSLDESKLSERRRTKKKHQT